MEKPLRNYIISALLKDDAAVSEWNRTHPCSEWKDLKTEDDPEIIAAAWELQKKNGKPKQIFKPRSEEEKKWDRLDGADIVRDFTIAGHHRTDDLAVEEERAQRRRAYEEERRAEEERRREEEMERNYAEEERRRSHEDLVTTYWDPVQPHR